MAKAEAVARNREIAWEYGIDWLLNVAFFCGLLVNTINNKFLMSKILFQEKLSFKPQTQFGTIIFLFTIIQNFSLSTEILNG